MRCCVGYLLLLLVVLPVSEGLLIIGPNTFRPNQSYSIVVSNFHTRTVDLSVTLAQLRANGTIERSLSKSVDVRRQYNKYVDFNIPSSFKEGSFQLTIKGRNGFSYLQTVALTCLLNTVSGLIQINKPVFKPGDTVLFRVVVLDTKLRPPADGKSVHVTIRDPADNVIRTWPAAPLYRGVFENKLEVSVTPPLGLWSISVKDAEGTVIASKTFEVKEYVLYTFAVDVFPSTVPLIEHRQIDLTVSATYHFGKPVKGTAIVELYSEDDIPLEQKRWSMDGVDRVTFNSKGDDVDDHKVRVVLQFIEQNTNRTVTKQRQITVYKDKYHVELTTESPQFRPGKPFECEIRVTYRDGKPATNVDAQVTVTGLDEVFDVDITTDHRGSKKIKLYPSQSTQYLRAEITIGGSELLSKDIEKVDFVTDAYIKVKVKSGIVPGKPIKLKVSCSDTMEFLVYYVIAKGRIVDTGLRKVKQRLTADIEIHSSKDLIPKSKIIVATLKNNMIVFDSVDVQYDDLPNKIIANNKEVKPGAFIDLEVRGSPGSYVALAAYDRGLLQHNTNHDLLRGDIMAMFDDFHKVSFNEYDQIASMGLFARTLESYVLDGPSTHQYGRGFHANWHERANSLIPYRINFAESWLWLNETIGSSGRLALRKIVPDTTTSWDVTGFAIDRVSGMGIMKKPVQLTTVQPFYIVENLPYSIKRGEAAVLQFTLFSNLDRTHTATVGMYNVANQTEFIGCPDLQAGVRCTKSVSVPPSVGVPVSFLVKSRKLGEMVVRVEARITHDDKDGIEKVIRVLPENKMVQRTVSRVFVHNIEEKRTFNVKLEFDKLADPESKKVTFSVQPNVLSPVAANLGNLLSVPTGSGEGNMVHFAPAIMVVEYLTTVESQDEQLTAKATSLMRQGYQSQMKYRQTDGSFGIWQHEGGSLFLTSFVANALQSASKYLPEIDGAMVKKSFGWLAAEQKHDGHFEETGAIIHNDLQGGARQGIALTSYILIAFLENENAREAHKSVIENGVRYLEDRMNGIEDIYDLAITTYAMMLHDEDKGRILLTKLIAGSTSTSGGAERYWTGNGHDIEMTAYALLAMIEAKKYVESIAIMRWLVKQRYVTGSFPRTQDTFVGLKALTKLTEIISPKRNDYSIRLEDKRTNMIKNFRMSPQSIESESIELPGDTRWLDVTVSGTGLGIIDVKYEYAIELQLSQRHFNLNVTPLSINSHNLKLRVCANYEGHLTQNLSNLALVEVSLPSGYVMGNDPIKDATVVNLIRNTEVRYGGTSVVVYYNNMGAELNCFTVTALRLFRVALNRPAYVFVHDFFQKDAYAIKSYNVPRLDVCDICENCDETCQT